MTADDLDLDALAAFEQAATPGPWVAEVSGKTGPVVIDGESSNALDHVAQCPHFRGHADAALIAALRNAAPALIEEVGVGRARKITERILRDDLRAERDAARAEVAAHLVTIADDREHWQDVIRQRDRLHDEVEATARAADAARAEAAALRERVEAVPVERFPRRHDVPRGWMLEADVRAALTTGGDQ